MCFGFLKQIWRAAFIITLSQCMITEAEGGSKGGKFLKKLWCYIGRRVQQGNLLLSTELIT